jgi:uncharacterized glyoxalase superfamily protein PhnB
MNLSQKVLSVFEESDDQLQKLVNQKTDLSQKVDKARRAKSGEPLGFDGHRKESAEDLIKIAELEIKISEIHLKEYQDKKDQEGIKQYSMSIHRAKEKIKKIKAAISKKAA